MEKAEEQEGAAQAHATDDVPFNTSMRRDWCEGKLTSNQVLEYAWGATQQGMGGGGKLAKKSTPKNSYRDLRRALGWPKNAPEYTWLEYRGAKGDNVVPVVCPIAYIESLVENDPTEFRNRFLGDDGDVRAFWEGLEGHVVKEAIADKVNVDTTIGLGFHGDSAPTTKTEGLLTIAWNSTTKGPHEGYQERVRRGAQVGHRIWPSTRHMGLYGVGIQRLVRRPNARAGPQRRSPPPSGS